MHAGPNSDISFWNLDWLALRGTPKTDGEAILIHLNPRFGLVKQTRMSASGVAFVLYADGVVESIDHRMERRTTAYIYDPSEGIVDMVLDDDYVFFISVNTSVVSQHRLSTPIDRPLATWELPCQVPSSARLAILHKTGEGANVFVGPLHDGSFLSLRLGDRQEHKTWTSILPAVSPSISPTAGVEVDARTATLIVADSEHRRILELDPSSGRVEILCGPGSKRTIEMDSLADALQTPRAAVVYRAQDLIPFELLSNNSREILRTDSSGRLPRTILIADAKDNRVKKFVELPNAPRLVSLANSRILLPFLGSGSKPQREVPPRFSESLSCYPICAPLGLSISAAGELLVQTQGRYLLLLRPSTAIKGLTLLQKLVAAKYDKS